MGMWNTVGGRLAGSTRPSATDPSPSPCPFDGGGGGGGSRNTSKRKLRLINRIRLEKRQAKKTRRRRRRRRQSLFTPPTSTRLRSITSLNPTTKILAALSIITLLQLHQLVISFATSTPNSDPLSPSNMNSFVSFNHQSAATGLGQRHSDHISLSEICPANRAIPAWKRIESSVISLTGPHESNCTISLSTRLPNQYFIVRFEELRLSCSDKLRLFDGDAIYGQASIKDYSCRDNMANVQPLRSTGSFLTLSYSPGLHSKATDGFRFVITAVYNNNAGADECPSEALLCRNQYCISRFLFCDGINHCLDSSDELNCPEPSGGSSSSSRGWSSWFNLGSDSASFSSSSSSVSSSTSENANLSNALMLLVILVLIIFVCVIIFISAIYCRRDPASSQLTSQAQHTSHYAQYQHQLAQARGPPIEMPLHGSSSVMFANPAAFVPSPHHQQQFAHAYFQPTPMLATATLDRRGNLQHHWQPAAGPRFVALHHPGAGMHHPSVMGMVGIPASTTATQVAAAFPGAGSGQTTASAAAAAANQQHLMRSQQANGMIIPASPNHSNGTNNTSNSQQQQQQQQQAPF